MYYEIHMRNNYHGNQTVAYLSRYNNAVPTIQSPHQVGLKRGLKNLLTQSAEHPVQSLKRLFRTLK